jgi:hypothetical protein
MAATKRIERQLSSLPEYGREPSPWREWLTEALSPAQCYRVHNLLRHGRQRSDACELVLLDPDGTHRSFEIEEQRLLSTPATLRATLVSATDGLVRPRSLTKGEQEDIWVALVTLATVTANQSTKAETQEWLEQTVEQAEQLTGYSLVPQTRPDALAALLARNTFDYLAARRLTDPHEITPPRPALLLDTQTGEQWMRVGELAAFWRHVVGTPAISYRSIEGRLAAIGVKRHDYTFKPSGGTPRTVRLYRVADGSDAK